MNQEGITEMPESEEEAHTALLLEAIRTFYDMRGTKPLLGVIGTALVAICGAEEAAGVTVEVQMAGNTALVAVNFSSAEDDAPKIITH